MSYDYIIVGAGSAGCVLAYRLSENPKTRVLLIEAGGPDKHPYIHIPKGIVRIRHNKNYIWSYEIEDRNGSNRPETWIRGRTLGGSSSVNGLNYIRGQAEDYDGWEALGNKGWGWRHVGKAFAALEQRTLEAPGAKSDGPMPISVFSEAQPVCEAMIAAGSAIGIPVRDDPTGPQQESIGYVMRTIHRGRRVSTATAFLKPARKRPNLRVLTGSLVEKVLFEGTRANGVRCIGPEGGCETFQAREIILSAGAIESPKLLQLSGVGPAGELGKLGIPVVYDSPGVGANFREHRLLTMQFRMKAGPPGYNEHLRGFGLLRSVIQYATSRKGVLASSIYDVNAFVKADPTGSRPDAQLLMGPYSFDHASYQIEDQPGLQCVGYPARPESRGSVTARSSNPKDPPLIKANYLSAEQDRRVSVGIVRTVRKLMAQDSMKPIIERELSPGPDVDSDEDIVSAFLQRGSPGLHGSGTCKMGVESDKEAVLDHCLRVRGVFGLRVVDASIMPSLISGNTNGAVIAIGWRAADLILQ